ncbi:hypothetical protein E8E13_000255 [Curvularia kusanoi]|uniref:DRBM domain-containing protein n=1 Tax=Curvularia kusanoi TaxID=90978 RepID=A0A9P4WBY6_CURKU|nr:hypothetical protein E8E13_000255 [Curvularia kusanoi]
MSTIPKAEDTNMEVDSPTAGIMSLDDFLATHQAEHDELMKARQELKSPPVKKPKADNESSTPQPIALGARSSKHIMQLHQKCQALQIPNPSFSFSPFDTLDSGQKWVVAVSFPGLDNAPELQDLTEPSHFNSKQESKEAVSKSAIAILDRLVEEGRIIAAKKAPGQPSQTPPKEKEEPGENFVGQLLEFQNATSFPAPSYEEFQVGTRFACLVSLEGHATPFSTLDALFSSKKAARQHAAGCAVAHLKEAGRWPESVSGSGIKKRKATSTPPLGSASAPAGSSAAAQVQALAHSLGFESPEYRFQTDGGAAAAPDLHTVSCFFRNGGRHAGPIGEVRNVFGRKKAREECARLVLGYLEEVRRERLKVAEGLIRNGGVAEVKVEEDESDVFEDALESLNIILLKCTMAVIVMLWIKRLFYRADVVVFTGDAVIELLLLWLLLLGADYVLKTSGMEG